MQQRQESVTTTLDYALRQFELAEANLARLEKLWDRIEGALPSGPSFGAPPDYDKWCIAFSRILGELPAIDGLRVENHLYDYDDVAKMHLDALEIGEFECQLYVARTLSQQGDELRQYRIRLGIKRREMVRDRVIELIDRVDRNFAAPKTHWFEALESFVEIDVLLGSGARPDQWNMFMQELETQESESVHDMANRVWPDIKRFLEDGLYGDYDPVPVEADDLNEVLNASPTGHVSNKLNWSVLSDEDFERLIFNLLSEAEGYENVQWLQKTRAADRGRDMSADRVDVDGLGSVRRYRTIIQCKHWLSKSVRIVDIAASREAMALWDAPRVDTLVIVTSGRFTVDAIAMVEKHNQSDKALFIEMWPDSHLERVLASRPPLLGQFGLHRVCNGA